MRNSVEARLSKDYRVVIPKAVRAALKLQPHDRVLFLIRDGAAYMRPRPESFVAAMQGLHGEVWADPAQWLEQERSSWEERSSRE